MLKSSSLPRTKCIVFLNSNNLLLLCQWIIHELSWNQSFERGDNLQSLKALSWRCGWQTTRQICQDQVSFSIHIAAQSRVTIDWSMWFHEMRAAVYYKSMKQRNRLFLRKILKVLASSTPLFLGVGILFWCAVVAYCSLSEYETSRSCCSGV